MQKSPIDVLDAVLRNLKEEHDKALHNCGSFYVKEASKKEAEKRIADFENAIEKLRRKQ